MGCRRRRDIDRRHQHDKATYSPSEQGNSPRATHFPQSGHLSSISCFLSISPCKSLLSAKLLTTLLLSFKTEGKASGCDLVVIEMFSYSVLMENGMVVRVVKRRLPRHGSDLYQLIVTQPARPITHELHLLYGRIEHT